MLTMMNIVFLIVKKPYIKKNSIEKRMKKSWGKPIVQVQQFVPQEYCDACFTYTATVHCGYGKVYPARTGGPDGSGCYEGGLPITNSSPQHGAPCANSYLTVTVNNGVVTYAGHEGTAATQDVILESVVIPGIATLNEGDHFTKATWTSKDGIYHHKGDGEVTSWNMTWEGHPNHS